ncbi:MAG: hypothetical protein Kow0092_37540 [Deferrisomatales bacterium]
MIRAVGLGVARRRAAGRPAIALEAVDLAVERGNLVLVLGRSGAGKTTLLEALGGILEVEAGTIEFSVDGERQQWGAGRAAPAAARERMGFLFQYPERQIVGCTPWEDVGWAGRRGGPAGDEVRRALERVELPEALWHAPIGRLSRGEKRRVALASVLVRSPAALLLDEPFVGLDPRGQALLWREVADYRVQRGTPALIATHWSAPFLPLADQVVCLVEGRVSFSGTAAAFSERARNDPGLKDLLPQAERLRAALERPRTAPPGGPRWAEAARQWIARVHGRGLGEDTSAGWTSSTKRW